MCFVFVRVLDWIGLQMHLELVDILIESVCILFVACSKCGRLIDSLSSHLFVCDRIKNEDASGIGRIGCGGSATSDIRRGRADTVI